MSSINLISIDPAQSAKSALHPEVFERLARQCKVTAATKDITVSYKKVINSFFGISKKTTKKFSLTALTLRVVAAVALCSLSLSQGMDFSGFSISWIIAGLAVSLLSGCLTRLSSGVAFVASAFMAYSAFSATGMIEVLPIICMAFSFLFLLIGPGLFSADQLLRKAMIKGARKNARRKANRLAERRLSYQAMRYI